MNASAETLWGQRERHDARVEQRVRKNIESKSVEFRGSESESLRSRGAAAGRFNL